MDRKALRRVEIKDDDKGEVVAIFATLNVIDSDGDVTMPGAFEDGAKTRISAFGHMSWSGALPVGKGTIREVGSDAVMEGRFFLDTAHGRDTFHVVKAMGDLQEWSYGYDPVKFSFGEQDGQRVRYLEQLKVPEVSPVLQGAGIGTRTVSAKSGGQKFSEQIESVLADTEALIARAAEVVALRSEKGKALSGTSTRLLSSLAQSLKRLEELVAVPTPDTSADDVRREFARFVSLAQESAA